MKRQKQQTVGCVTRRAWTDASVTQNGRPGQECQYAVVLDDGSRDGHLLLVANIGSKTVNDGEYSGVIAALKYAAAAHEPYEIITDSQLVARQVSGVYTTHQSHLKAYRDTVRSLLGQTDSVLLWRPRAENKAGWYWARVLKERAAARRRVLLPRRDSSTGN